MNNSSKFYDLKIFMKKNSKIIIISTFAVILALLSGVFYFISTGGTEELDVEYVNDELLPSIETKADFDELSNDNQDIILEYLEQESYSFRVYIQNEDSAFTDNVLLKQILINDELV